MKTNKTLLIISLAAAMTAAGCNKASNGENIPETDGNALVFEASIDATRVTVAGDGKCSWEKDDAIKIFWLDGGGAEHSVSATAKTAGASTTFSAAVDDADYYYAVYPATATASLS